MTSPQDQDRETANASTDLDPRRVVIVLFIVAWMVLVALWYTRPVRRDALQPQPLGYRLRVNHATADQFRALHGIGPALAQRIVEHRDAAGPFADAAALEAVSGIGTRTRARIEPWLKFE